MILVFLYGVFTFYLSAYIPLLMTANKFLAHHMHMRDTHKCADIFAL